MSNAATGDVDEYSFWGIVQKSGRVRPANSDKEIFYPTQVIQTHSSLVEDAIVKINHIELSGVDEKQLALGKILDHKLHDDKLFVKGQINRDLFQNFVQTVSDQEKGNIGIAFNDLVREIDAGNLALSAGLQVATAPTSAHQNTVVHIEQISEVSFVSMPASPASYAWGCDGSCEIVFGD